MRALAALLLLFLTPAFADAQSRRPRQPAPDPPASTLPPIGLPLPEIGLPLPPLGPAPPSGPTPTDRTVGGGPRRGRGDGRPPYRGRGGRGRPGVVYVVPAYPYPWFDVYGSPVPGAAVEPPTTAPAAPVVPAGSLWLDLQPVAPTQVFVDGVFVGSADDHGQELVLEAGAHQIELREPGYEPLRFDVRIEAGQAITYRGRLERSATAGPAEPAVPSPAIPRKPFYMIPGCYLGDVPPTQAKLPPTCDPARAVVVEP
jgi:hypothetical protein